MKKIYIFSIISILIILTIYLTSSTILYNSDFGNFSSITWTASSQTPSTVSIAFNNNTYPGAIYGKAQTNPTHPTYTATQTLYYNNNPITIYQNTVNISFHYTSTKTGGASSSEGFVSIGGKKMFDDTTLPISEDINITFYWVNSTAISYSVNGGAYSNLTGLSNTSKIEFYTYAHYTPTPDETVTSQMNITKFIISASNTITLNSPSDGANLTSTTFNWTITNSSGIINNVTLWVNNTNEYTNTSGKNGTYVKTLTGISEGYHSWKVSSYIGGTQYNSSTQYFTLDATSPTINLISPSNNSYKNSTSQTLLTNITDATFSKNLTFYIWNSTGLVKNYTSSGEFVFQNSFASYPHTPYAGLTPYGLLGYDGYIYLSAYSEGLIFNFSQDGTYQNSFYPSISGGFPTTDNDGMTYFNNSFYVADHTNGKMYVTNTSWKYNNFNFSLNVNDTYKGGMANDSKFVYTINDVSHYVYRYWGNGTYVNRTLLSGAGGLSYTGIEIINGRFYVVDKLNKRVYEFYMNGSYTGTSFSLPLQSNPIEILHYNNSYWITEYQGTGGSPDVYQYSDGNINLNGDNISYIYSFPQDGNYTWSAYGCDSFGNCGFSSDGNYTLVIDTTNPQISYGTGTESNGASKTQSFVYINVSLTEPNFKNITYNLYWSNDTLLNSTTYTTKVKSITFSGLNQGYSYKYNVTAYDLVNLSNSTSTRTITLTAPSNATGGGGGGTTIVGTGNWTMEVSKGIYSYDKILLSGTSTTLPISFYNTGEKNQTITLTCSNVNGTFCQYVDFGNASFNLPLIKDLQTVKSFTITIPQNISRQTAVFNIIGTDSESKINSISVTITTGKLGFFNTISSKLQSTSNRLFGLPYFIILLIPLIGILIVTTKFMPKDLFLRPLWIIIVSFAVPLIIIYVV